MTNTSTAKRTHINLISWTRDGDLWLGRGELGRYRISEWISPMGSEFTVRYHSKLPDDTWKNVGASNVLANAKSMAQTYDNFRFS